MNATQEMQVRQVDVDTRRIAYRTPMKFGGRVVEDVVLLDVVLEVEVGSARRGRGIGSMPMGNAWAWPSQVVDSRQTLEAMVRFGRRISERAAELRPGHPLVMSGELAEGYEALAAEVAGELELAEPMPRLAQLVAASPVEAALFDGFGRALGENVYDLLGPDWVPADLSAWLTPEFAGEYLDRYTLRRPKPRMPLYHLVGALDPLSATDVDERLDDGLPQTLGEWIRADGLTHLKIKLAGDDLEWDVERVIGVERNAAPAQQQRGCEQWWYSVDFNEKCRDVGYVLEFLDRLQERSPEALERIQYIEQPTHRDLKSHPENRMHEAARRKPVVIDESLVDFESLQLAREQGYSGVALKACKGQREALLMGAAAQKYDLFLCVQDLTCVGASFLHSASLAARIPTVTAIEGNGRQYCPAGNRDWEDRFPGMFEIHDGTVATAELASAGLGYA